MSVEKHPAAALTFKNRDIGRYDDVLQRHRRVDGIVFKLTDDEMKYSDEEEVQKDSDTFAADCQYSCDLLFERHQIVRSIWEKNCATPPRPPKGKP